MIHLAYESISNRLIQDRETPSTTYVEMKLSEVLKGA